MFEPARDKESDPGTSPLSSRLRSFRLISLFKDGECFHRAGEDKGILEHGG